MNKPADEKPAQTDETINTINTIESVDLDNVTGGCAACGMANCAMGANPTAARAPFAGFFNRR